MAETVKVELYTLSTCPWSRNAKAWLDDKRVKYDYVDYDLADEVMQTRIQEEMVRRGASAFPFVKIGETEVIVGFNPDASRGCWAGGATGSRGRGLTLVGVGGFEPPTSRSRTERSTKLSHTPTRGRIRTRSGQ